MVCLYSKVGLPPSMANAPGSPKKGVHGVRTGADEIVPGLEALKMLKEGLSELVGYTSIGLYIYTGHIWSYICTRTSKAYI